MSIWLVRAGKNGEYEEKFLKDNRIYLTWNDIEYSLADYKDKDTLFKALIETYIYEKERRVSNWTGQIGTFANKMKIGDWIVLPSKMSRTIHIGEIKSEYKFDSNADNLYKHYREMKWFAQDIPRDRFDQDILYSFGASMTICNIYRNDAEKRIKEMSKNNWNVKNKNTIEDIEKESLDLNEYISDEISKLIIQKFKGHRMEDLINEILKAKGFTTYRSPEGADHGVDLLVSDGVLGFGSTKICVQVKTTESPIDRPTLDQLIGTMSNFGADYGLLISWYGFKISVKREIPKQFFKVRLWDSKNIIDELFANYDKLSEEIKAEIPLKKVWMLNVENDD